MQCNGSLYAGCRRALLVAILALGTAGCIRIGPRIEQELVATSPAGATVNLRVHGVYTPLTGELFAVDDQGILLRADVLRRIGWFDMTSLKAERLGALFELTPRLTGIRPDQRERFAMVSRFAQGLEGELLQRVLEALEQPAVDSSLFRRGLGQ